jgi:transcriptional regulator with XRE-family HTH domain
MRQRVVADAFGRRQPKERLKTPEQSDMRAEKAWIKGSTAEILVMLQGRKMTGEQLKNLRKTLGLTQKELAEILGVTPLTIIRSEKSGPSRMVQSFIDRALRAGEIGLSSVSEPRARSAKDVESVVIHEPQVEYGKEVPKKSVKRRPKKAS